MKFKMYVLKLGVDANHERVPEAIRYVAQAVHLHARGLVVLRLS